jgi:hypothetical protein
MRASSIIKALHPANPCNHGQYDTRWRGEPCIKMFRPSDACKGATALQHVRDAPANLGISCERAVAFARGWKNCSVVTLIVWPDRAPDLVSLLPQACSVTCVGRR